MPFHSLRILISAFFIGFGVLLGMLCARSIRQATTPFSHSIAPLFKHFSHMASQPKTVIVVGSGFAGLAAAHEALKAGVSVHMLERAPKPGGNSIKASSGINGAGTIFQSQRGISDSNAHFYKDTVKSAGTRLSQDQTSREALIQALTDQSAEAIKWLTEEVGIDLSVVAALGGHSIPRTHRGSGKMPPGAAIVTGLLKTLGEKPNFQLSTSAEVTSLLIKDRNVLGVQYKTASGSQALHGPVIFATGGFAGDAQGMLARYRPDLGGMPSTNENQPGSHHLLSSLNVELLDMDSVQVHPTGFVDPKDPFSLYKFLAAEMLRGEGGILLRKGKRFINELETREVISRSIMSKDSSSSSSSNESTKQWDVTLLLDPGACEAAGSHLGFYQFKDLMKKLKIKDLDPDTIESIDKYAQAVASDNDEFGRHNFGHWRLQAGEANREEEVCVGKVTPVTHFTMGGVVFNTKAQVLGRHDGELVPVRGLWAAGEITGGLHGDNRLGGSSLLECAVFGREAGRQAARSFSVVGS